MNCQPDRTFSGRDGRQRPDAILVYGDEYRKENLRYVCSFWPIFERAVTLILGPPMLVGAPEGETSPRDVGLGELLQRQGIRLRHRAGGSTIP